MANRKLLYTHEKVRSMLARIGDLAVSHSELLTELKRLKIEVAELRAMHVKTIQAMRETYTAALARAQAHAAHRERELVRAWTGERDFGTTLH